MPDLTTLLSKFLTALYGGFGGANYLPSGPLSSQFTSVSNVSTTETDLMTYALPAGALSANGKGVRIKAWGSFAANGNSKAVKLVFGATTLHTRTASTNGGMWVFDSIVLRTSATAQIGTAELRESTATTNTLYSGENTTPAETLSGAVTIKVTGTSAVGSSDITQLGMLIEALP